MLFFPSSSLFRFECKFWLVGFCFCFPSIYLAGGGGGGGAAVIYAVFLLDVSSIDRLSFRLAFNCWV